MASLTDLEIDRTSNGKWVRVTVRDHGRTISKIVSKEDFSLAIGRPGFFDIPPANNNKDGLAA